MASASADSGNAWSGGEPSREHGHIANELRDFLIEDVGEEYGEIDATTPLLDLGILTSITVQSMLAFIEDRFHVSLPPEEVRPETFATLQDIACLIVATRKRGAHDHHSIDSFEVVNRLMESYGLTRSWIETSTGRHHVLSCEGKQPTLVLLSGLGSPASSFGFLMRSLKGRRSAIALDLAGFGVSEPHTNGEHSFLAHVRSTVEIIERTEAAPCVIVGNSAGAMIAAEIARTRPDLCRALVVISFGHIAHPERWWTELKALSGDPAAFWQRAFHTPPHLSAGLRTQLKKTIESAPFQQFLDPTTLGRLDRIFEDLALPTMFIGGQNDGIIDADVVAAGARQVPGARLEWLPKCGHYAQSERSEEVLVYLEDFLAQVSEGERTQ